MTWAGSLAMLGLVIALAHAPAGSIALAIDITDLIPLSDTARRAMVSETTALWKPHGVLVTWMAAAPAQEPLPQGVLRVRPNAGVSGPRSLGAVVFMEGRATPERTLMLSVDAVVQTVHAVKWGDRHLADLPAATGDHLIGRALGRVLAHEIGHYLLASRSHAADGLMRPEFRADQLVALGRHGFRLSQAQMPVLRLRLAQLVREQRHARAISEPQF